jgi:hypothetical protein
MEAYLISPHIKSLYAHLGWKTINSIFWCQRWESSQQELLQNAVVPFLIKHCQNELVRLYFT